MKKEKTAAVLGGIFATTLAVAVPVLALPNAQAPVRVAQAAAKAEASQVSAAPAAEFPVAARAVIDQYCTGCHNDRVRAASLILTSDKIDIAHVGANPDIWEKVVKKVGSGAMPKAGSPRPAPAVLKNFVGGLSTALDRVAAANPNPGRPVPHRLNRTEYTNAIRDFLALDVDGREMLPADDSGYGFDNIGSVLSLSPGLMQRYVLSAHQVARLAVGDPTQRPAKQTFPVQISTRQDARMGDDMPFDSRGGRAMRVNFPLDGQYQVSVRMQHLYSSNYIRGIDKPEKIQVRLDGKLIKTLNFGGKYPTLRGPRPQSSYQAAPIAGAATASAGGSRGRISPEVIDYFYSGDKDLNVQFDAKAGPHVVAVSFIDTTMSVSEDPYPGRMPVSSIAGASYAEGHAEVDTVQISAIKTGTASDTPSRRQIFVCHPSNSSQEAPCANRILSRLVRLAYRHTPTDQDLKPLLDLYASARKTGDFESGIEAGLERILIAPEFLFRIENDPAKVSPSKAYRVNDVQLASRLSFFLWSSIPDDELLRVAERGQLKDPKVLEQQVKRMLVDRRASSLVTNFADQWLQVRSAPAVSPDVYTFPAFDDTLRDSMQRETEMFVESQMKADRPLTDLLTADYTFLNQRLAEFYGIPGVYGDAFRKISYPSDNPRRGILGQGSVLAVSTYTFHTRTSPTLRGKYILELLGAPPPPPPPSVPALDVTPATAGGKTLTVRQQMEMHRKSPVCASCHVGMDPLGFALENFDAVGKWRTVDIDGTPIDASASLPDGTKFTGSADLRELLVTRREEFVGAFVDKLLTYALGRGTEYYDMPSERAIMHQAAANDYRWSSLILGVVKSMPFQERMSAPLTTAENLPGRNPGHDN
jgi:cytochrome c5